ncbi:MAG TPA: glycogen/starch/alpha-glucan family phosphorylase, partial [Chlamydiales bacterium]|nr:glycogen/starch/alpha-glucan family phosphorylase [Chlamydiales bacterium]
MDEIDTQAEELVQKIKHIIITRSGQTADEAPIEEFYESFCTALREEMMVNWTSTYQTFATKKPRMTYFLSMEYLPGRFLGNNITNIGAMELTKAVLAKMNRSFGDLIECEMDAGLGNGGLGRLSSCFLDSLATKQYPVRAYGLRYQYGIFEQEIWDGNQVEKPDCWLLNAYPWEFRRDQEAALVHYRGKPVAAKNKHGDDVFLLEDYEEVRALPYFVPIIGYSEKSDYSVLTMCLWSTKESPRNFQLQRYNAGFLDQASENTALTDVLYPNDNNELGKRMRLKQEFLLVSASLKDIIRRHLKFFGDLSSFGDKVRIQINDTHPAFVIAELVRMLTKNYDFSWKEAWETCQACCSYTNHTILSEGLEEWNETRVAELIPRQYQVIQKLNLDFCNQVRARFPGDEERVRRVSILEGGQVKMSHLAIVGSHKVNGVAKLHTEILKRKIFPDFYEMYPEKFMGITNGVTQRRWLLHANPLLAAFITKRIGKGWITDFLQMEKLAQFASDRQSQKEFLEIKKKNKEALIDYLSRETFLRDAKGKVIAHCSTQDVSALFDVQIKRIHEYKRQLLSVLHLIMTYQEIQKTPPPIQRYCIFGGKAAPGYVRAKQIIQLICALARKFRNDPACKNHLRIAFVENYNVSLAEQIIPAADLSEQISTAGWEASGTSNMKLAMNGALTIGTEDGANIEMREAVTDRWWPFRFGSTAEEIARPYKSWDIYIGDEAIRKALDSLKDGTFAENPSESEAFSQIYQSLIETDVYRVLKDLRSYSETQKKVEALFLQPNAWAETAIHNIAAMGRFSSDGSIGHYAKEIWGLEPCPSDPKILEKVRE